MEGLLMESQSLHEGESVQTSNRFLKRVKAGLPSRR